MLFRSIVIYYLQEIERKLQELGEIENRQKLSAGTGNSSENEAADGSPGFLSTTLVNICVIVGFAAFAYAVKCVLKAVDHS